MAAGSMNIAAAGGRNKRRRRPVMSEINVTPFVDVMLVLLIVFMVSAPLEARGGSSNDLIYIRGDRTVAYGMMMRVMGRISGAGYHRIALVTEVEQGSQ